jgi:hypothetical protein
MNTASFLIAAWFVLQGNAQSSGMILVVDGKATVQRATLQTAARMAELVRAGDRIHVETGKLTLVFCPTSEQIVLSAGTTIELQNTAFRVVSGGQPGRNPTPRCVLPQVALGQESLESLGGLRARGIPPISLFTGGSVTTSRPTFEWAPLDGSPSYQLSLKNSSDDVIWEAQSSGTKLAYPSTLAPLAPATYLWELHAVVDGKVVAEQVANFEVKPADRLSLNAGADKSAMLMNATILESLGYYAEAAAYFREIQKTDPDNRISRHLAWLYWNAGLIAASKAEVARPPR